MSHDDDLPEGESDMHLPTPAHPATLSAKVPDLPPSPVEKMLATELELLPGSAYRTALGVALLTRPVRRTPSQVQMIIAHASDPHVEAKWFLDHPEELLGEPGAAALRAYLSVATPGHVDHARIQARLETAPVPPPPVSKPVVLTELERITGEMLLWRYRAQKARTALAQSAAESAAIAEANAYQSAMNHYERHGVDVSRRFDLSPEGVVTYPEPSPDAAGTRYLHDPGGRTVKKCGGCPDKESAKP